MRVRRSKKIWLAALVVFVAVFLFTFLTAKFKGSEDVDAANLANFDPGYIISDYQMGNYNSMSEAEIQAFLTSKNPCNNTNYNYYLQLSANRNYTWHFENGHFICLSEERFGNNDNEIGFQYGESAAHIIWQTAQDYRINPRVLIVLLQKETGLVTDKIPNNGDYRKATGYGCPDTAACSSKYYGFKNQIRNAAALFRTVLDGGWTNYPLGNNYIQYNPSSACGGSWVNIRSLATSALYRYTPYQPNASALAAGYGAGDSCGAYGNRNFYNYFEDWFGGVTMEASYVNLDAPRYMELTNDVERINPYSGETVDILSVGMVRKYDSKIRLSSGEWCLRTEFSTFRNSNACVRLSDLKEIEFEYKSVSVSEREKIVMSGAKKVKMRSGESAMSINEYIIRDFVKSVEFQGVTYYVTEYDDAHNGAEYGIPQEYLLESYEGLDNAGEFLLTCDVKRVNPHTGSVYDVLEKGRIVSFATKIRVGGKTYYRTKNNTENSIDAAVLNDCLAVLGEGAYEGFISPREMVLLEDVDRIDPFTGKVYDRLEKGRVIKFSTKVYVNGIWYYRTENNTLNHINAVIPASYVGEKR